MEQELFELTIQIELAGADPEEDVDDEQLTVRANRSRVAKGRYMRPVCRQSTGVRGSSQVIRS